MEAIRHCGITSKSYTQGKDSVYADILNRIRFANHTENDMELLRARVSQSLPVEAIHLFGTNAEVNNFNEQRLDEMEGKLIELPAINIPPTIESYKPHVSKDGRVHESPLLSIIKLKKDARIMITYKSRQSFDNENNLTPVERILTKLHQC